MRAILGVLKSSLSALCAVSIQVRLLNLVRQVVHFTAYIIIGRYEGTFGMEDVPFSPLKDTHYGAPG